MARPRKYVQVDGREIVGVSRMPDGRFYIIADGRRRYFKNHQQARAVYLARQSANLSYLDEQIMYAQTMIRRAAAFDRIMRSPEWEQLQHIQIDSSQGHVYVDTNGTRHALPEPAPNQKSLADRLGIPEYRVSPVSLGEYSGPSPRLSEVLKEWRRIKAAAHGGQETDHIQSLARTFSRFVKLLKDLMIGELSAAQFRTWRDGVNHEARSRQSGKWANDQHAVVKQVLRRVRRENSDWPWPSGLSDWVEAYDRRSYQPKAHNKQPLPAEIFQRLLDQADAWAATDPRVFAADTQSGRALRRQARIKQHLGGQLKAALLLAANCGLDPVDFTRIRRENLRLDGSVPHLDLPRLKAEHRVGIAVDRKTPLLPATIKSLQPLLKRAKAGQLVFRSARGSSLSTLSRLFRKLADDIGVDPMWSFKHLRNIGPTLAKRGRLPSDERDAFLGHTVAGTSKFYEGDVDETYLVPLVNLIGQTYLKGEMVGKLSAPTRRMRAAAPRSRKPERVPARRA